MGRLSHPWRRWWPLAMAVVGASFSAACSPPEVPVDIGVREVPTDVVIPRDDNPTTTVP